MKKKTTTHASITYNLRSKAQEVASNSAQIVATVDCTWWGLERGAVSAEKWALTKAARKAAL